MELTAHSQRPPHAFRFHVLISGLHFFRLVARFGFVLLALSGVLTARAALQFDVFLGYGGQPTGTDGIIREAGWFPVACEVLNDGPPFNAIFEVSSSQMGAKRLAVELPTNTRKRFIIPMFAASGTYAVWEARLLDDRGKVRAEKNGLRPRGIAWESMLLGAVPRTFAGIPKLPELRGNNARTPLQPVVARMQAELMPDSPIALEGLDAIYLNSEKALELKVTQAEALVTWLLGGGHLIVGVEQPSDVNATAWLKPLLPITLTGGETHRANREVFDWLRSGKEPETTPDIPARAGARNRPVPPGGRTSNSGFNPYADLPDDAEFNQTDFPVATGSLLDGSTLLSVQGKPLIVTANRGRGQVTVLTFSPEREPFRSWKNREWFWAKVMRVPPVWFGNEPLNPSYGGSSIDGVFGSMIDSRQVRKLPVQWLLLLLVVYLLVIGPVDQYCLKKAGKQMLTWLTFPIYVVFFSLLIYYIGYKLRAGETEWNELHVVDILPQGDSAQWRGRTYASVYSPVNARYKLAGEQTHATLRGEFMGLARGGQEGSRSEVLQRDKGFDAEIEVPVWTSQLYVSDWGESGNAPLVASIVTQGANRQLNLRNDLGLELKEVRLVLHDRIYEIGDVPAGRSMTVPLEQSTNAALRDFVVQNGSQFQMAVQQRQYAFGDNAQRWVELNSRTVTAICFPSQVMPVGPQQRGLVYPAGMDLWPLVERGDAVLLAWAPGHSPSTTPLNRFKTIRSQRNTMFRLAIPAGRPGNL
jgi:hypothetical protein